MLLLASAPALVDLIDRATENTHRGTTRNGNPWLIGGLNRLRPVNMSRSPEGTRRVGDPDRLSQLSAHLIATRASASIVSTTGIFRASAGPA